LEHAVTANGDVIIAGENRQWSAGASKLIRIPAGCRTVLLTAGVLGLSSFCSRAPWGAVGPEEALGTR
jgi:hypothetical protein